MPLTFRQLRDSQDMDNTAHDATVASQRLSSLSLSAPPPFVLITSVCLVLIFALFAGNFSDAPSVAAQTTPTLVDYDIDDDGLIDIRTHAQFLAMDEDRVPPFGVPDSGQDITAWNSAYPNGMTGMGCPPTDHDDDPMTADAPRCVGYEMLNDLDFTGRSFIPIAFAYSTTGANFYRGVLRGNGYRIIRPSFTNTGSAIGVFNALRSEGRVEGLGVVSPNWRNGTQFAGGIAGLLDGTIIGSYVIGDDSEIANGGNWDGGLVGLLRGSGRIVNSFVAARVGSPGRNAGGLVGRFNSGSTCRNSYFSGQLRGTGGFLSRDNQGGNITNCLGDTTTGPSYAWGGANAQQNAQYGRTKAQLSTPTAYDTPATNNPFSGWNTDEDGDGEPDDVWDFGDETTLPVLKGYGHDRTFERPRPAQYSVVDAQGMVTTPADSVNLCTRTIAIANEIIRHLQDSDWRTTDPAITAVPADVASLTPCTSLADTRSVSVDHLRDFVVTSEANPFRLNPGRTTPASERLTALHGDDLAYLPNAGHFDFSGNALTTIPVRLFQGLKVLQLDLSQNAITSLHADTFADITAAAVDETTGNYLNLDNNRLTASGLPDRVFDDLPHLNGISLRSNALAAINTRWFQSLGNLGRRATGDTMLRPYLGLQLGGNAITEHYYWQRAFDDFRMDRVEYTGANAGASLLAAIKAQMQAVNTDITNLDLDSTHHLARGALGSGNCPSDLTSGPAGSLDFQGEPVQCLVAASWTPPWQEGASVQVRSATAASAAASITISFSHATDLGITAYQVRYRKRTNDPGAAWTQQWRVTGRSLNGRCQDVHGRWFGARHHLRVSDTRHFQRRSRTCARVDAWNYGNVADGEQDPAHDTRGQRSSRAADTAGRRRLRQARRPEQRLGERRGGRLQMVRESVWWRNIRQPVFEQTRELHCAKLAGHVYRDGRGATRRRVHRPPQLTHDNHGRGPRALHRHFHHTRLPRAGHSGTAGRTRQSCRSDSDITDG